jgi:FG-GAP repeat
MPRTHFVTTIRYTLFILSLALLAIPMKAHRSDEHHLPTMQGEKAAEYLKREGLDASLGEAMRRARYDVRWADRTSLPGEQGAYAASNPAQQFYSHFTPDGLRMGDSSQAETAWQMELKLRSMGYGGRQQSVSAGQLKASGNRIEYKREVGSRHQAVGGHDQSSIVNPQSSITEWYLNREDGLEQGFTLASAPGERRAAERLRLEMRLEGDLRARPNSVGDAIELVRANGQGVLRYEHLVVKDAEGRKLEAAMGADAGQLWLEVDDENAVYPVTIDPAFIQQAYLKASNTGAGDGFGASVAISGDTMVIGAPNEASNATGVNGDQSNNSSLGAGAAYVFVRSNGVWSQQAYLKASNTTADAEFGTSVAISGDTIVVGAPTATPPGNSPAPSGSAYVFVRSGVTWGQQALLKSFTAHTYSDDFGFSVAISGDTIVVGAPAESSSATGVNGDQTKSDAVISGAAYVFVRSGVTWSQQAYLKASNTGGGTQICSPAICLLTPGDEFGASVGIDADTIVVGAHFEDSNATGINGDQTNNLATDSGAAYVFVRSGVTWSQQAYLKASNTGAGDAFGTSVAVSGDTVVADAIGEASAGSSGAAYVFVRSGVTWSQQAFLKASNVGGFFGFSVDISGDALVIGADQESCNATGVDGDQNNNNAGGSGAAYAFARSGATWSQQAYLKASNTRFNSKFGISVGISGSTIVAGAIGESSNAVGINGDGSNNSAQGSGAAYVFVAFSNTNNQPSILAVNQTVQQGSVSANLQIATVDDVEDAKNTLAVTINGGASATVNGVMVSGISVNAAGVVTADVAPACAAATGNFTLQVQDSGGLINQANLTITVTPNTLPLLGTYLVTSVASGASVNVTPSAPPSDNGTVNSVTVGVAPATFTGMATVNPATGVVSITNADPPGVYTVTVTATDNCGAMFAKTFRLTVNSATGCTIIVNSTAQEVTHANPNGIANGNCTLGEAILTANTGVPVDGCTCSGSGSPYTIVLSNTTYTLTARDNADFGFNGLPSVTSEITIQGNGATIGRSSAGGTPTFRLFFVAPTGDLTLQNVTLQGGLAKGGNGGDAASGGGGGGAGLGGAVYNRGRLTVTGSTLTNNTAQGGNGGNSPGGPASNGAGGGGGLGGNGGGSIGGNLIAGGGGGGSGGDGGLGSSACNPCVGSGGGGGGGDQIGGNGGNGSQSGMGGAGGLNNGGAGGESPGNSFNGDPGSGIGGGGGGSASSGAAGDGNIGGGGGGAGAFGFGGNVAVFSGLGGFGGGGGGGDSPTTFGNKGGFGGGGGGGFGAGGFGGGNGGFATGGGGGGAGMGGAIFSDAGLLVVTNSTLSTNFATGGAPGAGISFSAPTAGQGYGGGIFARNANVTINYVTLNNNSVTDGASVAVANGGGSLYLMGDGQMATRGDPTTVSFGVTNTILANTPGGASDAFVNTINSGTTSPGTNNNNLVEVNGSTPGSDTNDLPGVTQTADPLLGPLVLNAPGNTPTHALLPGSPAIDQAVAMGGVTTDQRGAPRPIDDPGVPNAGDGSDIGAFEAAAPGSCMLTCSANITATAGASCPVAGGTVINYPGPSTTGTCGTVTCSPSSGSLFPVGTTTVTCTTTAGPGCSFTVTVLSFCLQDDSNPGNVVLINAQTGDYSFCCGGVPIASGRGILTTHGCIGSIDNSKGDRQVHIQWDTSANNGLGEGTAYVQKLSNKIVCQITDKNMSNNTCQCSAAPPPGSPRKPPKERTL